MFAAIRNRKLPSLIKMSLLSLILLSSSFLPASYKGKPLSPAAPDYLMPEYMVSTYDLPESHRYRPMAAFNSRHNEYLVVWHNTWDNGDRMVYARRLDIHGKPIGQPFQLSNNWVDQVHPNVVYNSTDDVYMVVWMFDASGNNTRYEIYGSIIPWDATNFGTSFFILGEDEYTLWKPSVAWNSVDNQYLVISDTYFINTMVPYGILGQLVDSNSTLGNYRDIWTADSPIESDMVFHSNGSEKNYYLVSATTGAQKGISFMQLSADISGSSVYSIFQGTAHNPALAKTDDTNFLVAWDHTLLVSPFSDNVSAICVDKDGYKHGSTFSIGEHGKNFYYPDIGAGYYSIGAESNQDYLLVAETSMGSGHVEGYRMDCSAPDGGYQEIDEFEISLTDRTIRRAAAVGGVSGFLIAYESRLSGATTWQRIYARKYMQPAVYLPYVVE